MIVNVKRRAAGGFAVLHCELDVPASRMGEVVSFVGGAVGEAASWLGRTVGCVGVVGGEEPVLVALSPARDVVAERVRETLERGEAHRWPQLYLTLEAGRYLAQVVDPYVPFRGTEAEILGILRSGRTAHALRTEVRPRLAGLTIVLTVYTRRPELRRLFTLARRVLADLPGWSRTR